MFLYNVEDLKLCIGLSPGGKGWFKLACEGSNREKEIRKYIY